MKPFLSFKLKSCALLAEISLVILVAMASGVLASSTNTPAVSTERAPDLKVSDRFLLAIPKAGFGKEYLFTASLIPQAQAPTSTGLAAKIIKFELFPDGVDMYEATEGLVVTEDLPARRLLASFPIVRQDAAQVVVDFNRGMRRVFTQAWTESGLSAERDRVLEVPEGRVFEMRQEDGRLIVRQSVQVRNREDDRNLEQRVEVRYFLSPYQQGACEAKEPNVTDGRYTRFFETEGRIEPVTGRVSSRIARFDIRKPIVFHYSANTPADYVQAVKDGILYWNRAFGKEIVQAQKAPDGVTAPDADLNIIQWVPWDNAGFAYADVLLDPLTGESGHGQAYITSVFGFAGKSRARALLRAMLDLAETKKDDKKNHSARFGVPFLGAAPACDIDPQAFALQMAHGLEEVLASDELTDEAVLRVSQDYVRETVSHEVGHVLGLRHNFAGSLEETLSRKELDDWFKAYITGKPTDAYTNKITSSSMMEYTIFKGAVFTGWLMRTTPAVLPHDHAAIAWGYFDSNEAHDKKMLFASDEDVGKYGDVRRFDYGTNPVVNAYAEIGQILNLLPNNIIETFISARAPRNAHDRIPLAEVNLNYAGYASQLANQFADILYWFRADARSLGVENQFDFVGDLNQKERLNAHLKYVNSQIEQLGGVDRAIFSFLPLDLKLELKQEPAGGVSTVPRLSATNLLAKLEKLLDAPTYQTFVGLDEKKYTFTKEEKELIVKRSKKFFEELEKEVVKDVCQRLTSAPRTLALEASGVAGEEDNVAKVEQRIIEMAKLVITAKEDSKRLDGKIDKGYVQVVEYKYDQETRVAAAKALDDKTGSFKGWAEDAKSDINTQLKNDVEAALNLSHFKDFKVSLLSRSMREWYQKQQEVLALLPPAPGSSSLPAR